MECKLRCFYFRRVSDFRRAFWPALGVTGISDDLYWSTIGVILIFVGIPRSAREYFGCTWEQLGAPVTNLEVLPTSPEAPMANLGALIISLGVLVTSLGALRTTVEQSGKHIIIFGNAAGVPGNHTYYLLFNDF